ncbi:TIGR02300 family protein [Litoreibacter arenae]|uniref:Transcription initiation factor TFIIIB, Brf1 subunit/Transcription initiation factor TFIIB n=1 Tax=Litoreibacter arenae DSM 19593 TaxID=1123360 RepID=S9QJM0_9RHOB|nr:TIGR02300 family protein [Litoreibacter arenae]EPX81616.1 Transcription initiation factor TFIIIB, Brf1 subunit/Transcription initiation factor TFIIB [Litoreibacter arenae DSM 19593]
MPKEEWGVKRVCPSCSTRFYDLRNDPMTCPSCAHEFTLESITGNKSRTMQADKADAQNKDIVKDDADEVVLEDDEDDVDADLGDDVLEDDDDDDTVSLDELADVASDDDES